MSSEAINAVALTFKKALVECALGAELSHHYLLIGALSAKGRWARGRKHCEVCELAP